MNRQTKRMMQRQGQVAPDGSPEPRRAPQTRPAPKPPSKRTSPGVFLKEVRGELRKVAWPTRAEVVNYSIVVLVALIVLTLLIFALDWSFGKAVIFLFK